MDLKDQDILTEAVHLLALHFRINRRDMTATRVGRCVAEGWKD